MNRWLSEPRSSGAYQKFVILAMPRTGSNYLSHLLHSHPHIVSLGEMYDVKTIWAEPGKPYLNHSRPLIVFRNIFPFLFLRLFVFHRYPRSVGAVGFRLFYDQTEISPHFLEKLLVLEHVTVLHLKRRNMLENFVSLKTALKTGKWEYSRSSMRLVISPQECQQYFEHAADQWKKFDTLLADYSFITVYYEDLYRHPQKETAKILSFLGIEVRKLTCSLRKQNTRPMKEIIVNYTELKKYFFHTKWRKFFLEQ